MIEWVNVRFEWVNVRSTAIRRVGYDTATLRMHIDFEDSVPVYIFRYTTECINRNTILKVYMHPQGCI